MKTLVLFVVLGLAGCGYHESFWDMSLLDFLNAVPLWAIVAVIIAGPLVGLLLEIFLS